MKRMLILTAAALAVFSSVIATIHRSVLFGEDLLPVPEAISLAGTFPPAQGWSSSALGEARRFAQESGATAVIVIHQGQLVAEWGATQRRSDAHSVRKSLVSALVGAAVDRKSLAVDSNLETLGVDDIPALSTSEKQATLADFLTSRTGIYRDSVKADVESDRPMAGSHSPGKHFFYNNWSFNALGGIFQEQVNMDLGTAFDQWLATPLGMQDFRPEDVRYIHGAESRFPAYRFWISPRDLARLGVLYFNKGHWGDRQLLPAGWIQESTRAHVEFKDGSGYGYLWWTYADGSFWAAGTGSQMLLIDPSTGLVVVSRVDTRDGLGRRLWYLMGQRMSEGDFFQLVQKILLAAPQ